MGNTNVGAVDGRIKMKMKKQKGGDAATCASGLIEAVVFNEDEH